MMPLDGGTFSTAADVTAVLRSLNRATFVGEESAGAYVGNTSGLNALVVLPNSRLRTSVQMYGYVNAVKPAASGRGTIPDYVVPRTTSDILRGADEGIVKAIEILTAAKPMATALVAPIKYGNSHAIRLKPVLSGAPSISSLP